MSKIRELDIKYNEVDLRLRDVEDIVEGLVSKIMNIDIYLKEEKARVDGLKAEVSYLLDEDMKIE